MKKALKVVGVVAVAGAGLYACNYYKQYRKFKKMEERMEKLPLQLADMIQSVFKFLATAEKHTHPIITFGKYNNNQK